MAIFFKGEVVAEVSEEEFEFVIGQGRGERYPAMPRYSVSDNAKLF